MARLFVNQLTVIDCAYLDRHRGVVGESWIVDIELAGALDEQGMVFDFGHVKKQIKHIIDTEVDHRLLVPMAMKGCKIPFDGKTLSIEFPLANDGVIRHQSPHSAVLLMNSESIDIKSIASHLQNKVKQRLPNNISDVVIKLRTETIDGAYYHYTHGLQQHQGHCQRIAHGHRSRLEIEIDGQRQTQLETQWALLLKDSYIATNNHIIETFDHNHSSHTRLAYIAQQGGFSITLPTRQVFNIPTVSTVENIAAYLAEMIAKEHKGHVVVRAFEGVEKGAIGEAYGEGGIFTNTANQGQHCRLAF
jgi:6-pyruvoyl-tetrahydropterin synthase